MNVYETFINIHERSWNIHERSFSLILPPTFMNVHERSLKLPHPNLLIYINVKYISNWLSDL